MKAGCLFIIAVIVSSYFGYRELFLGTELEDHYWLPVVLGVLAGFVVANIQGIFVALKQRGVLSKPRSSWTDGEFVGISGRIQAVGTPLKSPFSDAPIVIGEYEIKYRTTGKNNADYGVYSGFLMAPCAISSRQGSIKLVGFPLLSEISASNVYIQEQSWHSVGKYLASCKFEKRSANPLEAIKQLNAILRDDDGELRADYIKDGVSLHLNEDGEPATAEEIATELSKGPYYFEEKSIPNGAEVTAFGTYRSAKQVLDIGSGLSSISHGIKLGSAEVVTRKAIRLAIFMSIFFTVIFVGVNIFVLKNVGYDLGPQIEGFLSIISDS